MPGQIPLERLQRAFDKTCDHLLSERVAAGHWEGELSTSALSTATAVMALELIRRDPPETAAGVDFDSLIHNGLQWLANHQNDDGGWGDTTKSITNISTSMLTHAVFHATGTTEQFAGAVSRATAYLDQAGGVPAVVARYGKDRTFSIPILTHCALAGLVSWKEITSLPFEMAWLPPRFYKTVKLPVVSYALPALIAIGQVKYHHRKPWNPFARVIRWLARKPTLKRLSQIQPDNGGFLEATPLTSFVTMSLAGMGLASHPVAQKGLAFLVHSVREDGSWPIDTNLATWVTTLSINGLKDRLPEADRPAIRDWLLAQQYREVHPYTNTPPGGWAWTDLPGGVPDADDTPGAILALFEISDADDETVHEAATAAVRWLLGLQNRDHGWPTFCRGWGTLPFDRSSADITAHVLRALLKWSEQPLSQSNERLHTKVQTVIRNGFDFLRKVQRDDGSWLPLWFGHQFAPEEENPTYGTTKVLAAFRDANLLTSAAAVNGFEWLKLNQNDDGGWGGIKGVTSSVEETSLAVEILASASWMHDESERGLCWLMEAVEQGTFTETTPIGFYFAKLWYFEKLYPQTFIVSALGARLRQSQTITTNLPNNSPGISHPEPMIIK